MLKNPQWISQIKSNCVNTLYKFYNPAVEAVEKLNFFNPEIIKDSFYLNSSSPSKGFSGDLKEKDLISSLSK